MLRITVLGCCLYKVSSHVSVLSITYALKLTYFSRVAAGSMGVRQGLGLLDSGNNSSKTVMNMT